ncbi:MAG TPA: flagellar assembly protein FliW [Lachnospiraceae bacterium]|nr:flagellar assembly protein FliW [Lachnospiraceae bacterium]
MKVNTKIFGEVDIEDNKIVEFTGGIVGFPELTKFALIFDEEKGADVSIRWLQSMQEPGFAMPIMDPLLVKNDYNPEIEDELLKDMGDLSEDNLLVLVTVTVPADLTQMSVNLRGPIIINSETRKACQIIIEGDAYHVKFPIYEILKAGRVGE